MGNAKIDLGLSTEEKPEWTISLDFLQNDKEEEKKEIKKPRESIFNDAQDSDFLSSEAPIQMHTPMEDDSGFSISGDLDESIQTTETSVTSTQESVALDFASNDSTSNENMTMLDDLSSERDEDASTMLSDSFDDTEDASTMLSDSFDDTGDASTMLSDSFDDTEDPSSMIAEGPATDASESLLANEVDAVDERLTHLANSMGQWDQSENVLSEAAAMLSQEEKSLNVSEQQLNTNKFDGSAPVEQTEPVSEISDSDRHETELGSMSFENREITNDMFDMGYDFSDETENYSDENINLDSFKGSIKDADEFAPEPDNSLNLDESESGTDSSDLDLSNLVAAAMSNLSHHQEEQETEPEERAPEPVVIMESVEEDTISKSTEYDEPTVEAVVEEPILESIPVPVEEVVEDAVDEPAEETVQNLVAEPAKEPEPVLIAESTEEPEPVLIAESTEEPEPELVTEPTEEPEPVLIAESTEEPEPVTEPMEEPEPITEPTEEPELVTVSDIVEKAEKGELPEWKASPEDFSHSVSTTTKQASDEDDIASLIIEDYIEVPTVTEVESKLKKREKEKKKSKSKDKNADGFAFSLEDINAESEKMPEEEEVADEPNPTPVEEDSPAQTESDAVQGDSTKEIAATAEEAPAVPEEPVNISTVYAKHLIRKEGKVKRSYYSLYYK